jgi:hypothetical protein
MPSVTTFFRHCPACGRRFEVRLVGKNLVGSERDAYPTTRAGFGSISNLAAQRGAYGQVRSPSQQVWDEHVVLEEKVRVTVMRKEFQYSYKCKHCGHQWIEKRSQETEPRIEKRRD